MTQLSRLSTRLFCLLSIMVMPHLAHSESAQIETSAEVPASIAEAIRVSFKTSRPKIEIETIRTSQISGLYAVKLSNGPVLYTTEDGRFFVLGDLYQVNPSGFVNLAERDRESARAQLMAQVKTEDMIVFSPAEQPAKAAIMVFTDVDCFYCQKLHKEVPDLNRLGIEVRYLAYPRAGVGSESYNKIVSAWCATDKQTAITKLKNRERIATNLCAGNPVEAQFKLGQQLGVNGTPAMVTTAGRLLPGYMPALELASVLGVTVDTQLAAELQKKQDAQSQQ